MDKSGSGVFTVDYKLPSDIAIVNLYSFDIEISVGSIIIGS